MFFAMLVGPSKVRMYSQDKEYELHGDVFISHAEEPEFALIIKPAKTFNLWIRQVKYRPTIREDFFKKELICTLKYVGSAADR